MQKRLVVLAVVALVGCKATDLTWNNEDGPVEQVTVSAAGLWTHPNPLGSEMPDGAAEVADDGVIRRPGLFETRRGFKAAAGTFGAGSDRLNALWDYAGTLLGHTSANAVVRYSGGAWTAYSGTYTPPASRRMRTLQAAGSLYFTTTTGVKRLDELTGSVLSAGVPQALIGTVALSSNGAHATGTVTLGGGAGNVTITVGGTAVGPVAFNTSDAQTALDCITALNANATVAALVTASSGGSGVVLLTAVQAGTVGDSITLVAARTAGTATASGANLSGGNDGSGWLPADSQTAYRLVWGYRNADNRIILGAPSGRMVLTNPSTETLDTVALTVALPSWVTTDYFLQVYRADTTASDDIPAGDDMWLAYEAYPTAAEVSAGSMTITDIQPDDLKAQALYSSPNAGIPGSEKFEPPVCRDLALYKERMICAATVQRQRIVLTLLSVDASSGGMDDLEGLVFDSAGGGGGGTVFEIQAGPAENVGVGTFKRFTTGTAAQNVADTAQSLVRVLNAYASNTFITAHYISGEYDNPGRIMFEASDLGAGEFAISGTNSGPYWAPAFRSTFSSTTQTRVASTVTVTTDGAHHMAVGQTVELLTSNLIFPSGIKTVATVPAANQFTYTEAGTAGTVASPFQWRTLEPLLLSESTEEQHGISYSEFGEPDAVPLGNYMQIGSSNYDVERTITLGDVCLILKTDGVYFLGGDTPATFSVRPLDLTVKIIAPDSAVTLGGKVYALTDQGVVAITENGVQVVSRPIERTLADLYTAGTALRSKVETLAFGVAYETEREYHLYLPTSASDTYATQAYVLNVATGAWTRHTLDATAGYVLPGADIMYLGNPTANNVRAERKTLTAADFQDEDGVPIVATYTPQVRIGGAPSAQKKWVKSKVLFEGTPLDNVTLSFATELSPSPESGVMPTDGLPYVQSYVPVDKARSQRLTVGVSGGQAGRRMSVSGVAVDYTVMRGLR